MKKESIKVDVCVKLDAYKIISDAIDRSVDFGWNRAHKHTDTPSAEHIKTEVCNSIMNELCEILKFDDV